MKRIQITPKARRDILLIWDYITGDSVDEADRVIARIRAEFQRIAERPGIGHRRSELDPIYLVWGVDSFLIIYRPDTRPVQIIRVVRGSRDLLKVKP